MAPSEAERLARIEEQISGVRDDIGDIKTSMKSVSDLHLSFLSRSESEKIEAARDRERDEVRKEVKALWRETDKLKRWRSWITGALVTAIGLVAMAFDYLHQWLPGGGKP